jgi:hypothetical protein
MLRPVNRAGRKQGLSCANCANCGNLPAGGGRRGLRGFRSFRSGGPNYRIHSPTAGWTAAPRGTEGLKLSHPADPTQRGEQVGGLLGVELMPQGVPPHILERDLCFASRPDPAQHPPGVNMPFGEADLPQGRSRVGPEVFPNEPDSSDHVLGIDANW